ncbi:hypothetical protein BC793_13751 [Actinoplanes xinjiangensis]|uniref:Uncharacterized protein n=1 Tax=Actinoplanes xinjiangensis TaxID=512350 RepID=A0A316EMA5_9ACTN|nr:hypothetical protein BC793_13751 [Actinoplanes xinjiangensis]
MTGESAPPLWPLTGHLRCRLGSMSDSLYGNSRSVICKPDRRLPRPASTTVSRGPAAWQAPVANTSHPTASSNAWIVRLRTTRHLRRVVQNLGRLSAPLLRRRTERLSARPRGWEVEWPTGRSRLEWPAGRLRVEWPARRSRWSARPGGRGWSARPGGREVSAWPRDRETKRPRDQETKRRRGGVPAYQRVPRQCRDDHRDALGAPEQRAQRMQPLPRADRAGSRGRRGDLLGGRVVEHRVRLNIGPSPPCRAGRLPIRKTERSRCRETKGPSRRWNQRGMSCSAVGGQADPTAPEVGENRWPGGDCGDRMRA